MRNETRLVLLAVVIAAGVLLTTGTTTAEHLPPRHPKGQIFAGSEMTDPTQSLWVVAIGQGAPQVPLAAIDYESDLCLSPAGKRRPAVMAGLATVGPIDNDLRRVESVGAVDILCANPAKDRAAAQLTFDYSITTGELLSADHNSFFVPICTGTPRHIASPNLTFNYINATNGGNSIEGTEGPDIIDGRAGNDTINGNGGPDVICTGADIDVAHGNAGLDLVFDVDGKDTLWGDQYIDVIIGGRNPKPWKDVLLGGPGWDRIFGWLGNDRLVGGPGADILYGGPGFDNMFGGPGGADECYDPADRAFYGCEITG